MLWSGITMLNIKEEIEIYVEHILVTKTHIIEYVELIERWNEGR